MSVIDRARWVQLEPLLDAALEMSDEERAPWLDELRSRSPDLADHLTSILSGEPIADLRGFLSQPVDVPLIGLTLGGYTLERSLGQGGMGSVWLARRTDGRFEGTAAVKLLNLSLLTATGQARFHREGSTLARLTHPGIGRLLDAGVSPGGQPYLVLEYVEGERIDAFVKVRALSRDARIKLVLQVLSAVSHAHANLIVHRDIKPSNILVTPDGTAKLLDFGIAKLIAERRPGDDAHVTAEGGRALTPEFAAPEQVRGDSITTATDVYALGALLYLLLSGRHPTGEGCRTPAEAIAAVLDVEPRRLGLGDLDTVLAKALHKAPEHRYQTASAFADDLERYLRHEPVSAERDALVYRFRKFVRRHRVAVGLGGGVALLIIAYAATVTVERARIRDALDRATLSSRKTEQVTDFMLGLFQSSDNGKSLSDTVRAGELLTHGLRRVREMKGQPEVQAQMLEVIGRLYAQLGEYLQAEPLLQEALDAGRRLPSTTPMDSARMFESLSVVELGRANYAAAVAHRRASLAIYRAELGATHPRTTNALFDLASSLHQQGKYKEAAPIMDEWTKIVSAQPPETTAVRAQQLRYRATILQYGGHLDQAEPLFRDALAINRALYGERHVQVAESLGDVAYLLDQSHRSAEAERMMGDAVGTLRYLFPSGSPSLADGLRLHGVVLEHMARYEEAKAPLRESMLMLIPFQGEQGQSTTNAKLDLAFALSMTGGSDEAAALCREAIVALRAKYGDSGPLVQSGQLCLADALRGQKKYAEAESLLVRVRDALASANPSGTSRVHLANAFVRLYEAQGREADAAKYRPSKTP